MVGESYRRDSLTGCDGQGLAFEEGGLQSANHASDHQKDQKQ
jgi:hypothetical protein